MSDFNRRTDRVFAPDGRSLILAFDHGAGGLNYAGMRDPGATLADVVAGGADAVLTTVGTARKFARIISRIGLCLSLDNLIGPEEYAIRHAVRLGADMAKVLFTPWSTQHPDSMLQARRIATLCEDEGLPIMVEAVPVSFEAKEAHTPEKIGQAAKMACELGADVLKIHYTGDRESFEEVLAPLYLPVVILGGPKVDSDRGVLEAVSSAMDAGAVGVAMGRNIWGHPQPGRMVAALAAVIHGGATVDEALGELSGGSGRPSAGQ